MIRTAILTHIIFQLTVAIKLNEDVCQGFEVIREPVIARTEGEVIENKIIIVEPSMADDKSNDYALKVVRDNITIRNVIIYHAANAIGIYGWQPNGLRLENVQVIAYGNEWGAQACPTRTPFRGYDCSNIKIY